MILSNKVTPVVSFRSQEASFPMPYLPKLNMNIKTDCKSFDILVVFYRKTDIKRSSVLKYGVFYIEFIRQDDHGMLKALANMNHYY